MKTIKAFLILFFDPITWRVIRELIYVWYLKKYVKIYRHIDYLPLFNFSEIMKGNFEYLFVNKKSRVPKLYFKQIFEEMSYQFKKLDNSSLRDLADLADFKSKYARTKDKRWLNKYNFKLENIKKKKHTKFDLNNFTDYIERTYDLAPGAIDANKISTSKAFQNYQRAIKINLNKSKNGNNK